jgi:hypothetical protein
LTGTAEVGGPLLSRKAALSSAAAGTAAPCLAADAPAGRLNAGGGGCTVRRGRRDAGLWLRDGRRRRRLSAGEAADYDRAMERFLERRWPATGAAWDLHDGVVLVAADGEIPVPRRGDRTFRCEPNVLTGDDGRDVATAAAPLAPA